MRLEGERDRNDLGDAIKKAEIEMDGVVRDAVNRPDRDR